MEEKIPVYTTPGTITQAKAPWESYNAQFEEKLDPNLEDAVKRYSDSRHVKTSTQNQEELCRQKEMSDAVARQYQWLHPNEYADAGPRMGHIIHSSELINILRNKLKLRCWYRDHPQRGKITLVIQRLDFAPEVGCWVQAGYMPEYTIFDFDNHGVPLAEKYRGWRTCTLQLILKGLVSEDRVNKIFGYASGPVCRRYLETLHGFRNRRYEVI